MPGFSATINSTSSEFNITDNVTYLVLNNSFQANITVGNQKGYTIVVNFDNASAVPYYYRSGASFVYLRIRNESGDYSTSNTIASGQKANFTIIEYCTFACPAGRHKGSYYILNSTNSSENASVIIFVDIPVYVDENGIGSFSGTLPTSAPSYHSYFFNTSNITNATGVTVNISWSDSSKDLDLFLVDELGNLTSKSINRSTTSEILNYNYLPFSSKVWEIRIGNSTTPTSYNGTLTFTTLDIINGTTGAITRISSINFGILNASSSNNFNSTNITLNNTGNITLQNVQESKELYYIKRFGYGSPKDFTVLIPDNTTVQKIKASLNWTGSSNYSLFVYNPAGILKGSSTNKFLNANVTGVNQEEYVEIAQSDITIGSWNFTVVNNTNATYNPYNLTVLVYVNASKWINSTYTTITFNITNTSTINVSLTVQNDTLDGKYEGTLRYTDSRNGRIEIPLSVIVNSSTLVVNNTLNSTTIKIDENIGANLTRIFGNVTVNNTGTYDLTLTTTHSSFLILPDTTSNISFNYTAPTSISAGSSGLLNITLNINTVNTSDTEGQYYGWIFLNATDAHPYLGFNLTLQVNLTRFLNVSVVKVESSNTGGTGDNVIYNSSLNSWVNVTFNVRYINGTLITGDQIVCNNVTNFKQMWLYEPNASYTYPESGNLTYKNSTPSCDYGTGSGNYTLNLSVPSGVVGGIYQIRAIVNTSKLTGQSVGPQVLIINDTGLHLAEKISLPYYLYVGEIKTYSVLVKNYGPFAASSGYAKINFSENCAQISVTNPEKPVNIEAYNTTGKLIEWSVTGVTNGTCPYNITNTSGKWFPFSLSSTIDVYPTTTTTEPSLPPVGENVTAAAKYLDITSYPTLVSVVQGSTNSTKVTVKNINTTRGQDVKLTVENINSTWFSSTPALLIGMLPLNSTNFTVLFSVPADAEVKDYSAKFTAISNFANVSKTFTLRVLPRAETKVEINATLASFKQNMTELWGDINQSAEKGINVTLANATFFLLKALIDQAQTNINQGDYNSAYYLFDNIRTLFNTTRIQLNQAIEEYESKGLLGWLKWPVIQLPSGMLLYLVIFGGIAAAIILAYLFWPVKTEKEKPTVEPLYVPKEEVEKEDVVTMLKKKWGKLSKQKK